MRIAFGIVSLFPGGGLQRDCIEIAKLIRKRGHDVVIYTSRLNSNTLGDEIPVIVLQNNAVTNHQKQRQFAADFLNETARNHDLIVGFDKLSGLDILYCADASMHYRVTKNRLLRLLPRYRAYSDIEQESFLPGKQTRVLLLSQNQMNEYWSAWKTEQRRLFLLPPTVTLARRKPESRVNGTRQKLRAQLGIAENDWVWISIGVQPNTKGLDRVIRALAEFPSAQLLIAGVNETNKVSAGFARYARRLGVSARAKWLGHREDIATLMAAADVLVHPARYDTTGTVILEAIVNGLPVITTSACGYAPHVEAAQAGIVVREPFDFQMLLAALESSQDTARLNRWSESAVEYGEKAWLYEGQARAADIILSTAFEKNRGLRADHPMGALPMINEEFRKLHALPIAPET